MHDLVNIERLNADSYKYSVMLDNGTELHGICSTPEQAQQEADNKIYIYYLNTCKLYNKS